MTTDTPPETGARIGQMVAGASLLLIGVGWLLEVADVADVPWSAALPAILMVVGAGLVLGARSGPQRGLVALGVVLTVVVVVASAAEVVLDVPFSGGIGEKTHVVTGPAEAEYRWGVGKLVVDLTDAELGSGPIEISLTIGELLVFVPPGVAVDAGGGIGEVVVFGERSSGLDPGVTAPGSPPTVEADVGLGRVEVRR
ncbi:MAG: hypothetical protein R3290_04915 [Acidimicrobiia bacterium]|nr:hypothetical protein [Acidimicrobiia bacterium]